jgi:DNA primase
MAEQVENALLTLSTRYLERRQRELRSAIAEAERRGDHAMVETLTLEKMKVDRALREL